MLRIDQLRLHPGQQETLLRARCAKLLRVAPADITACTVLRKAIDAREDLTLVYTVSVSVKNEAQVLRRCRDKRVSVYKQEVYFLPPPVTAPAVRPIVVGAGPAGLFAALVLARCGARPILLERGRPVEHRQADVERFWSGGPLDPDSNVQFGEGGAGAFSDGKLNTGTKDLRHRFILEMLVRCGAPDTILTDAKPHVGTDKLHIALQALRQELEAAGADIRFNARLEHIRIQDGAVSAVTVCQNGQTYDLPARHVLLALGHSARDTFEMLYQAGLAMEPKPFAMGVRIEHRQSAIDAAQYRSLAGHPALPPSTYKLSCHLPNGRSAFSFCVCPGSEAAAYALTGGFAAPCQRVADFLTGRPSAGPGTVRPSYRPGVVYTDLRRCLPDFISETLALALPVLGRQLRGYDDPDALLTGVETRSSSPVRLVRDAHYEANIRGIFPCGEGAGYAGGILSAAADGMRCAEKLLEVYTT